MKRTLTLIVTLLLAPPAALHAAEPVSLSLRRAVDDDFNAPNGVTV